MADRGGVSGPLPWPSTQPTPLTYLLHFTLPSSSLSTPLTSYQSVVSPCLYSPLLFVCRLSTFYFYMSLISNQTKSSVSPFPFSTVARLLCPSVSAHLPMSVRHRPCFKCFAWVRPPVCHRACESPWAYPEDRPAHNTYRSILSVAILAQGNAGAAHFHAWHFRALTASVVKSCDDQPFWVVRLCWCFWLPLHRRFWLWNPRGLERGRDWCARRA